MKRLKSLLSLVLVLVTVLSFAVPAMAAVPDVIPYPHPTSNDPAAPALSDLDVYVILNCQDCSTFKKIEWLSACNAIVGAVNDVSGKGYYTHKCTVTVSADSFTLDTAHTAVQPQTKSFDCFYNAITKKWEPEVGFVAFVTGCSTTPSVPSTPVVPTPGTGSYTITYKASGNWPYSVSVPVDAKTYKYGDKVTLQNPAKTVIADTVGGTPGYWVFNGWTVTGGDYWYGGNCNKYYHSNKCGYYNGVWHCDKNCWYYDCGYDYNWHCNKYDDWSFVELLKYCRENGIRFNELTSKDFPLNFKVTNDYLTFKPTNVVPTTSVTGANGPYYTANCGHKYCTGKYCDVYYACDHDQCPAEYCKYWYSYKDHVCSHTACPDFYCKYWSDCEYYSYYYNCYYPTQTITVTGNMTVYGSWSFQPVSGTLVLSASTLAASDYSPASYTFEIYSSLNAVTPVKTVTVKAGTNQYVSLNNGTYYIRNVNANVNGYKLDTAVTGDVAADGSVIVVKGNAIQVKYTYLYTDGVLAFNTTDHVAYLTGFADGTVKPNDNITREQVAAILYRLLSDESRAANEAKTNNYADVKDTRWSNVAISTLANAGIMGNNSGNFRPADNMTRAELVDALVKITGISGGRTVFTDTAGHWAASAINAAANEGWITGYTDGTIKPDGYLTRAEVATIINRVLDRNPSSVADLADGMKTFTDNMKTTKWYYLAIQEAANGHSYLRDTDGSEYWTGLK